MNAVNCYYPRQANYIFWIYFINERVTFDNIAIL